MNVLNAVVSGYIGYKKGENPFFPTQYNRAAAEKYRVLMAISNEEALRLCETYKELREQEFTKEEYEGMNPYFTKITADSKAGQNFPHLVGMYNITASTSKNNPPAFIYMDEEGKGRWFEDNKAENLPSGSFCKMSIGFHAYRITEKNYGIAAYLNGLCLIEKSSRVQDVGAMFGLQMVGEKPVIEHKPQARIEDLATTEEITDALTGI